jgi:hypothetical protein
MGEIGLAKMREVIMLWGGLGTKTRRFALFSKSKKKKGKVRGLPFKMRAREVRKNRCWVQIA